MMIVNEDLLNVMGNFSETALDCIEKQNEEIEDLKKENAQLKDKLKDIEKILDTDCCVENIYQAMCQYLNIHDFELDLEDYLKEN